MGTKSRIAAGGISIFLLGSAFHFLYDLLGKSALAAIFFAVNESVWEHMKLLSTAALVWMAVDGHLMGKAVRPCCFAVRAIALPAALLSIPLLFYFLKGAFGMENIYVDIGLFLLAAFFYQALVVKLEKHCGSLAKGNVIGASALVLLFLLFVFFTFLPPRLPLFLDAITGTYGIPR